ncbi:MAG: hypothetical protein GWO24_23020 [Akkermansiaceae bacterium]|nr:hypothetical protein [Akkermansiaceae bacterium]
MAYTADETAIREWLPMQRLFDGRWVILAGGEPLEIQKGRRKGQPRTFASAASAWKYIRAALAACNHGGR